MSQHDFDIANQTASNARADLNNALKALATLSSGSSAPSTTYANMLWYDTGNNILKMRTEADDAWIDVGYLCQSTNKFCIFDDTNVVNSSGTQVGLIGDQPTSDWEAGTSTTESLVSPEKVKAAIEALAGGGIGTDQSLLDVTASRSTGTSYQNTTGTPIGVFTDTGTTLTYELSSDNSTWVYAGKSRFGGGWLIVPLDYYYRIPSGTFTKWVELR